MNQQDAVELFKSEWWKGKSHYDIVKFQLIEVDGICCMPFDDFMTL